jgi:serine carboxypeptidase-like 19/serine carboxypeptidase-like clade 1
MLITMMCGVVGPITFINDEYNGSLPNLALRPHSWTKVA